MIDRTGILERSPLVYVLASVRFAPWPLMVNKLPEIHEELRQIAPLIHHVQVSSIGQLGQVPLHSDLTTTAWMMMPSDRSYGIQLSQDQLLIISKKYERYSGLAKIIENVLSVLLEKMRFVDVTNIGIRYIDKINAQNNENISKYVGSALLPIDVAGFDQTGGILNLFYSSEDIELQVNSVSKPGALSVPSDLIPLLAMLNNPNNPFQVEHLKNNQIVLDIDSIKSFAAPKRLDQQEILDYFNSLHEKANYFFRSSSVCTDHAFEVWKRED